MAVRSMLAKDWQVDVDTASNPPAPVWVQIRGLKSMQEQISETEMDDSDFDSGGYGSDIVTQRKVVLVLTSSRKQVVGAGFADDPGQSFVRTTGRLVGYTASIFARYYRKDGAPDAYYGECHVDGVGGGGGNVTDLEGFSPTLKFHGQPQSILNPLNIAAAAIVSGISPSTMPIAGGILVALNGTGFNTVAASGAVVVAGVTVVYTVESNNRITFISPAHAAGSGFPVVVTNTTGASTTGATAASFA